MKFRTVDIVGAQRGILLGQMSGIYEVLNFMTGDDLYTHQSSRARDEASRYILDQHPWIAHLDTSSISNVKTALAFAAKLEAEHGDYLELTPMPVDDHDVIDPLEEASRMVGADRVIRIDLDNEENE